MVDGAGSAALALPLDSLGPNGIAMGWTKLTCSASVTTTSKPDKQKNKRVSPESGFR